jgi:hypothetical protein
LCCYIIFTSTFTPEGSEKLVSASMIFGPGFKMSITRLCIRISNCSRASLCTKVRRLSSGHRLLQKYNLTALGLERPIHEALEPFAANFAVGCIADGFFDKERAVQDGFFVGKEVEAVFAMIGADAAIAHTTKG